MYGTPLSREAVQVYVGFDVSKTRLKGLRDRSQGQTLNIQSSKLSLTAINSVVPCNMPQARLENKPISEDSVLDMTGQMSLLKSGMELTKLGKDKGLTWQRDPKSRRSAARLASPLDYTAAATKKTMITVVRLLQTESKAKYTALQMCLVVDMVGSRESSCKRFSSDDSQLRPAPITAKFSLS